MTTKAELITWLKSTVSNRVILVEITGVLKVDGSQLSIYLSNKPFVSRSTDTPASTSYTAAISGGITFSENLNLDGSPSLGFGDIELDNRNNITGGDEWFQYVWTNKPVTILIGDVTWSRSDFYPIFSGLIRDIDTSGRSTVNLLLVNRLEKLNISISETLVGGTGPNKDKLIPLTFGECFNVSPILVDPATLTYQVHNGPVERIIEVRDNGAALTGSSLPTYLLSEGKFSLNSNAYGTITASVQGYKKAGTTYSSRVGSVISSVLLNYITVTPTYSLGVNTPTIVEGDAVTFTLLTTDVDDGVLVPYTISGANITAADLALGSLTGNFTVVNNQATLTLTAALDALTENVTETFTLALNNLSGVSAAVTITSSRTTVVANTTSVVEGDAVTFTITPNFNGAVYWTLDGTNVTAGDFTDGLLSGSFTGSKNVPVQVTKTLLVDTTAGETAETFVLNARAGSTGGEVIGTSQTVTVTNTAATVTVNNATPTEGDSVTFTVTPNYTGTLYWSIQGSAGFAGSDFTDATLTGTLSVVKDTAYTVSKTIAVDDVSDPAETFTLAARTGSTSGLVIGTSPTVAITNTSATVTANNGTPTESDSVTFTVTPNYTGTLYWSIQGSPGFASSDLTDATLTGSLSVVKNTAYTVSKTIAVDEDIATLSILLVTLPEIVVNVPYFAQLTATGTQPVTFSATGLPAGLQISSQGVITGTATATASGSTVVTVTDINGTATRTLPWQIVSSATTAPIINTVALPVAPFNSTSYLTALAATGTAPIAWKATTKNKIPNPFASGLVAGSPGTLPPGWITTGNVTGLTRTIAAATVDGRPGISVRYQGTAVAGSLNIVYGNNMPALPSTQHTRSVTWRLSAGSWAPITSQFLTGDESNSGGTYITSNGVAVAAPTATATRITHTFTTTATTASGNNYLSFQIASGAADFTLEFGSPQFEQGASASAFVDPALFDAGVPPGVALLYHKSNVVPNGNFWQGTTGWNKITGSETFAVVDGALRVTGGGAGAFAGPHRSIATVPGTVYRLRVTIKATNRQLVIGLRSPDLWPITSESNIYPAEPGTYELTHVAEATTMAVYMHQADSSLSVQFDVDDIEVAPMTRNRVRNPSALGASVGTPGNMPTNWATITPSGTSRAITATGMEEGLGFATVRFSGTPSVNGVIAVYFDDPTGIPAAAGELITFSYYQRLVAGSMSGITAPGIVLDSNTAGGGYVANIGGPVSAPTSASLLSQRASVSQPLAGGGTVARVRPYWFATVTAGVPIDATIQFAALQIELGSVATTFVDPRYAYISGTPTTSRNILYAPWRLGSKTFGLLNHNSFGSTLETNIASYSGRNDAIKVTNTAGVVSLLQAPTLAVPASSTADYYATIYAKKGNTAGFTFNVYYFNNTEDNVSFNFDTLAVSGAPHAGEFIFQAVGNGWYRCGFRISRDPSGAATLIFARAWESFRGGGVAGNFTHYADPMIERGSISTPYIDPWDGSQSMTPPTWNRVRNPSGLGYTNGVFGGAGVSPTNWWWDLQGVTTTITGAQAINGLPALQIRTNGTPAGGYWVVSPDFIGHTDGPQVTPGQQWSTQVVVEPVSGTFPSLNWAIIVQQFNAAGTYLRNSTVGSFTGVLDTARTIAGTLTVPSDAVHIRTVLSIEGSGVRDITFKVGGWQLDPDLYLLGLSASNTVGTASAAVSLPIKPVSEIFTLSARTGSVGGTVIGTSPTIAITNTSATVSSSVSTVNEGGSVVFTVVPNYTGMLYWSISAVTGTVFSGDFTDANGLSGSISVVKNGAYTITKTLSSDATTEVLESFRFEARTISITGTILDSATVTINDTSVTPPATATFTAQPTTVNEGSNASFTFTTNATGVTSNLYFVVNSVTGATSPDFAAMSGLIAQTGNTTRTITISPVSDLILEGVESFTVSIREGSIEAGPLLAVSNTVSIQDTSSVQFVTPATSINEGVGTTYNISVSTQEQATTLYWTIQNITSSSADFSATSGTLTGGTTSRSFTVTTTADSLTEGSETFNIAIRTGSTSGTIVAQTPTITINDTSLAPVATITSTPTTAADEGATVTFNVSTTGFPSGTLYYTITGTGITAGDFTDGLLSGSFSVAASAGSLSKTLVNDSSTEGAESFTLQVRTDSISGTIIGTRTITINDTSFAPVATVTATPATTVNEGVAVTFNISMAGFTSGTLYYSIAGTNITAGDFTDGTLTGSFTVASSTGSVAKTILSDQLTEGAETFTFSVRTVSISGTVIGTININITDTSTFATSIKLSLDAGNSSSYAGGTGTTWTDLTGTGNGTLVNGVKYTTANAGLMHFDDIDDYVTVPNNLTYSGTLGFSFSVWVMPFTSGEGAAAGTGNGGYGRIVDKSAGASSAGAPTDGFSLRMNATQDVSFQIGAGTAVSTTGNQIPYGAWTHLVVSVSAAGAVSIYKNGNTTAIASGTTAATSTITTANLLNIGNRSGTQDSTFSGNIPVVKFYTKALTTSEVASEYALLSSRYTTPVTVTSGALLYVDAKDYGGSGTTWSDTSGNSNNLTLFNTPTFSRANAGYFTFNGSNQYAERTAFTSTVTSATFLAWVYDTGLQTTGAAILFNRHAADANAHGLNLFDSGAANSQNLSYHWNDATYSWNYNSTLAIPDGAWCMVALTVTSTNSNFYLYTTTTTPATATQSGITNSSATFAGISVGRDSLSFDPRYFNGRVGAAVFYNRALSTAELTQNYDAMRARFGV